MLLQFAALFALQKTCTAPMWTKNGSVQVYPVQNFVRIHVDGVLENLNKKKYENSRNVDGGVWVF